MENVTSNEALRTAIACFPTLKEFATAMEVRYQVVQQWLANRVPAEYCPKIERLTDRVVTCEHLRPDVDWAVLRMPVDDQIGP